MACTIEWRSADDNSLITPLQNGRITFRLSCFYRPFPAAPPQHENQKYLESYDTPMRNEHKPHHQAHAILPSPTRLIHGPVFHVHPWRANDGKYGAWRSLQLPY